MIKKCIIKVLLKTLTINGEKSYTIKLATQNVNIVNLMTRYGGLQMVVLKIDLNKFYYSI
jgi:hypothetical protein